MEGMRSGFSALVVFLSRTFIVTFIPGCVDDDDGPSDAVMEFTFHSGCPSVEVKLYIDNEYRDLIYTDGSYQYHVDPGTHSYTIRRTSDNEVLWSGQITISEGIIQPVTLTCSKG